MHGLGLSLLLPDGCDLRIDKLESHETRLPVQVSARRRTAVSPVSGHRSRRVHSAYGRKLHDQPWCGTH